MGKTDGRDDGAAPASRPVNEGRSNEPVIPRRPRKKHLVGLYEQMKNYVEQGCKDELVFSDITTRRGRADVHQMAEDFNLWHKSKALRDKRRVVRVRKRMTLEELKSQKPLPTSRRSTHTSGGGGGGHRHSSRRHPRPFIPAPPEDEERLQYFIALKAFAEDGESDEMEFPPTLTSTQRSMVHGLAEAFFMTHHSHDVDGGARVIKVAKRDEREVQVLCEQQEHLRLALEQHARDLEIAESAPAEDEEQQEASVSNKIKERIRLWSEVVTGESRSERPKVRFMNWNIEWMDHFYDEHDKFRAENLTEDITDVHELCTGIAGAIDELDPDVLSIEEGPANSARMNEFIDKYLGGRFQCFGGEDGMQQKVFILVKSGGPVRNARPFPEADEFLTREWLYDVKGSLVLDKYKYTRRPTIIRAEVDVGDEEQPIFFIAMHTKSKYIATGKRMWESPYIGEKLNFVKKAIRNRRRIAAECARTRKCLDQFIWRHYETPLVLVSGDLNDGPGMDFFEEYYLLFDSVGSLLGNPFAGQKMLTPVLIRTKYVRPDEQYSVTFYDYVDRRVRQVLLDHIFVSHTLEKHVNMCGIGHTIASKYAPKPDDEGEDSSNNRKKHGELRQYRLSDHAPVYCDLF